MEEREVHPATIAEWLDEDWPYDEHPLLMLIGLTPMRSRMLSCAYILRHWIVYQKHGAVGYRYWRKRERKKRR